MFRQLRLDTEEEIQVAWLGLFYEGSNAIEFGPGRSYDHAFGGGAWLGHLDAAFLPVHRFQQSPNIVDAEMSE